MTIRECPRCRQLSLAPTGAFWACANCVTPSPGLRWRSNCGSLQGEKPLRHDDWMVLISLIVSLGLVVIATAALWLWTILAEAPFPTASVSLPPPL